MKLLIMPITASVLLAAHFSRVQNDFLAIFCLIFPLILLIKKNWIIWIYQIYLVTGGVIWIETTIKLRQIRVSEGEPWIKLVVIEL